MATPPVFTHAMVTHEVAAALRRLETCISALDLRPKVTPNIIAVSTFLTDAKNLLGPRSFWHWLHHCTKIPTRHGRDYIIIGKALRLPRDKALGEALPRGGLVALALAGPDAIDARRLSLKSPAQPKSVPLADRRLPPPPRQVIPDDKLDILFMVRRTLATSGRSTAIRELRRRIPDRDFDADRIMDQIAALPLPPAPTVHLYLGHRGI
ncbi:MAG: hypothetical protein WCJ64_00530 [Rhodospirillaceae bacterium]